MRLDERRGTFPELEIARGLQPQIRAAQAEIDSQRELPQSLTSALTSQGMFRLLLPAAMGGAAVSLPQFVRCVEAIAEADGSVGWCVGQGGVFANVADFMSASTATEVWGANPQAVVATGAPFGASAMQLNDGYRLNGEWRFASGVAHATWLAAMANIVDRERNVIGFGMFLVPRNEIDLADGWNVRGLRGTGSRTYTLHDHPVPTPHALLGNVFRDHCGAATGLPAQLLFASAFGSVGLGIARRALDALLGVIDGKTPKFTNRRLRDDDMVHVGLAKAEALWGASRAFLLEVAEACAYTHQQGTPPDGPLRTHLRLAATNAMRQSGAVVDTAYELAGSDVIFDDHPLQRCFQDVHALTQQVQGRPAHFRTVGRVLVGLEPDNAVL